MSISADTDIEELFKTASLWQVGENKEIVKEARQELVSIGIPALKWVYENKFTKNIDTLDMRAIEYIFVHSKDARDFIIDKFKMEKDIDKLKPLIYLAGKKKDIEFKKYLIDLHKDKRFCYNAIASLSNYGEIYSQEIFIDNYKRTNERKRINLIHIIGKTKEIKLLPFLLKKAKRKSSPLIYYGCIKALRNFPLEKFNDHIKKYPKVLIDTFFETKDENKIFYDLFKNYEDSKDKGIRLKVKIYLKKNII